MKPLATSTHLLILISLIIGCSCYVARYYRVPTRRERFRNPPWEQPVRKQSTGAAAGKEPEEDEPPEMSKIVQGTEVADIRQFKALVYLSVGKSSCTGSIISQQYVLTASHCVYEGSRLVAPSGVIILAGNTDIRRPRQTLRGERIIPHPHYNERTSANDIAVIRTNKLFVDDGFVGVVPLSANPFTTSNVWATTIGWGKTDGGRSTTHLLAADVPVVNMQQCHNIYQRSGRSINWDSICAGGYGRGACFGDSGGPLLYMDNHGMVAVGVASYIFGPTCAIRGKPDVYDSIGHHAKFIASVTADCPPIFRHVS